MARDILKPLQGEHDLVRDLFQEMESTSDRADHHAKEEEKTMFKMARNMFSTEELARLDEAYEAWKASPAAARALAAAKGFVARARQGGSPVTIGMPRR